MGMRRLGCTHCPETLRHPRSDRKGRSGLAWAFASGRPRETLINSLTLVGETAVRDFQKIGTRGPMRDSAIADI